MNFIDLDANTSEIDFHHLKHVQLHFQFSSISEKNVFAFQDLAFVMYTDKDIAEVKE